MTVTADNQQRVTLPGAKPGDVFDLQCAPDGSVILRKLPAVERSVTYVRKGGLLLAHTKERISFAETREGIERFAL